MAIWYQDNVQHERLYWLAADRDDLSEGDKVVAGYSVQQVRIESSDVSTVHIRLNDHMMNLNKPVRVTYKGETVYNDSPKRTIETLVQALKERGDPKAMYTAEITVAPNK